MPSMVSWPVSDRFEEGIVKIKKEYKGVLQGLEVWIEKQKRLRQRQPNAATAAATAAAGGGVP